MDQLVQVLLDTTFRAEPVVGHCKVEQLVGHFDLFVEVALYHRIKNQLAEACVEFTINEG
jgi:hypothetical protein